jgi:hypothetical protein
VHGPVAQVTYYIIRSGVSQNVYQAYLQEFSTNRAMAAWEMNRFL